jgi:AraC-like DNA-binding protein
MSANLENFGYKSEWSDFFCDSYEGYLPNMSDYHMHEYYEISLILCGNVKVLLPNSVQHGTESRLVLTPPMTSHLILCEPQMLYKRINLLFSADFLEGYLPERKHLLSVFERNGRVIPLTEEQLKEFSSLAFEMQSDENLFRRRLRLMLFLSKIADQVPVLQEKAEELPSYVTDALSYLQEHYAQKILAADLAWQLGVGRTTLMTAFKKYTGTTLNEYLTRCRLKQAIKYLRSGETQQTTADICGFGDACNLIRAFKRCLGCTPGEYLKEEPKEAEFE